MHFISQGDCIVTSAPGNEALKLPDMILTPGNIIGHSEITHKASIQYFGDIRAHLKPVKTYRAYY